MDTDQATSDDDLVLWVMIAQTRDAILRARQREYARFNISNERRSVLWSIRDHGGHATPVEIAHQLFRELHSVTEMLVRMEKENLITRYKGSGRSRSEVKLTPEGLDVYNQSLHDEADARIFSVLTKKQRERLTLYLSKLRRQAMKELGIPEWQIKFPLEPRREREKQSVSRFDS